MDEIDYLAMAEGLANSWNDTNSTQMFVFCWIDIAKQLRRIANYLEAQGDS